MRRAVVLASLVVAFSGCLGGSAKPETGASGASETGIPSTLTPVFVDPWGDRTRATLVKFEKDFPPTPTAGCGATSYPLPRERDAAVWRDTDRIEARLTLSSTMSGVELGYRMDQRDQRWLGPRSQSETIEIDADQRFEEPGQAERWSFQFRFNHGTSGVSCAVGVNAGKLSIQIDAVKSG